MGCTSSAPAAVDPGVTAAQEKAAAPVTTSPPPQPNNGSTAETQESTIIRTRSKVKDSGGLALTVETPTTTSSLGSRTFRYAAYSRRGRDPDDPDKPNQDAYSIHDPAATTTHTTTTNDDSPEGTVQSFRGDSRLDGAFFGVYDGHGPTGRDCSQFVRDRLPALLQHNTQTMRQRAAGYHSGSNNSSSALTSDQIKVALQEAHVDCNEELHQNADIPDGNSGTTAISLYVHVGGGDTEDPIKLIVSNVGDSRAILGTTSTADRHSFQAVPLSNDQTPKRTDEADRCRQRGARILSFGELDPSTLDDDDSGTEIEDPPRVWHATGKYPGTAFTRSLGDAVAETLGVVAEPEQLTLTFSPAVQCIVLASDGIFDVLSNQHVMDICARHYYATNTTSTTSTPNATGSENDGPDPHAACREIVQKSHEEWLLLEGDIPDDDAAASYDDMTLICIFWGTPPPSPHPDASVVGDSTAPPANHHTTPAAAVPATDPSPHPPSHPTIPHQKRIRQKTLRNLEEMSNA